MSTSAATKIADGIAVKGAMKPGYERVLTADALAFAAEIERKFGARRTARWQARAERQKKFDAA